MRRLHFSIELLHPVMGVTRRSGYLLEGPAGWGECSPLASWNEAEREAAERSALEAAMLPFPATDSARVAVNAMIPRVAPDVAATLALNSGCGTVKVKVGDADSLDRVAAVRAACGPGVRIRLDANGAWDVDTTLRMLTVLSVYDIELVEDPVVSLEELATLRGRVPMPIAAESSIRTVADARRFHDIEAADVIVLKPQRIGGVREALRAAEAAGVPAIASSALETSVGLAAVVALAASLPESPFAHGAGTALLLATDVVSDPLLPVNGWIVPRRPHVRADVLTPA
ncbi:MAG TPA: enolase C-terminal domain-like protein [Candidatus Acidoferrales bacterium]|nr:enolase C-terminal domain-like protein [Candidatus Acidoferrales bacterium]